MSHKEEEETMDDVPPQHEDPPMNIPLQRAVFALMAKVNMQRKHDLSEVPHGHGESSSTSMPPAEDPDLLVKKRSFDNAVGVDDDSRESEKKKKEDHKPRNDNEPRNEQEDADSMILMSVSEDSDQEIVEKKKEDQKLRHERTEKLFSDIGPLTYLMKAIKLSEFDYGLDDGDDLHGAQKRSENPMEDVNYQDKGEPVASDYSKSDNDHPHVTSKGLVEENMESLSNAMDAVEFLRYQAKDEHGFFDYAKSIWGIGADKDDHDDPVITLKGLTELWAHLDTEITIFECILDYKAKKRRNPLSDINDLTDLIKNWLHIDVPVGEFNDLMLFLKMKYAKRAGKRHLTRRVPKTRVEKVLKLAHQIWGLESS